MTDENKPPHPMSRRFRGFLPVVVDVETAGFNPERDALLEVAAVILTMDDDGWVRRAETHVQQIDPFEGANLEQSALDFTGIDPWNPEREAVPEREGLSEIFSPIRKAVKTTTASGPFWWDITPLLTTISSLRPHCEQISGAIHFIPFPLSIPPLWPAWRTAIRFWPRLVRSRAFRSAIRKPTPRPMMRKRLRTCSAAL